MRGLMQRAERLARLEHAERELKGARSAYTHGRYATYEAKVRRAMELMRPLVEEIEQKEVQS